MAYGVFGAVTYAAPAVVHYNVKLFPTETPGGGGGGDTRPPEGKMFPRGK